MERDAAGRAGNAANKETFVTARSIFLIRKREQAMDDPRQPCARSLVDEQGADALRYLLGQITLAVRAGDDDAATKLDRVLREVDILLGSPPIAP